jgi:hypothetical protein
MAGWRKVLSSMVVEMKGLLTIWSLVHLFVLVGIALV